MAMQCPLYQPRAVPPALYWPSGKKGYVFAVLIVHLHVLHHLKVLAPRQGGEVSLAAGTEGEKNHSHGYSRQSQSSSGLSLYSVYSTDILNKPPSEEREF